MDLGNRLKDAGCMVVCGVLLAIGKAINETLEQTKHLYYHLSRIDHERVEKEGDYFFEGFPTYIRR